MRLFLLALALVCPFVHAEVATTRAKPPSAVGTVSITVASATEFSVRVPVKNARSAQIVVEWRFQKNAVTNGWFITNSTLKDLRGGVADMLLTEPTSVWEYALGIGDESDGGFPVGYGYAGGGHNNELLTALSIKLDGAEIGVASGSGGELVINQTLNLLKPAGSSAGRVIGSSTLKHTITRAGIVVEHTHTVRASGLSWRSVYAGQMPINNKVFNRAQAGNDSTVAISGSGKVSITGQDRAYYSVFNTDKSANPYWMRITFLYGRPERDVPFSAVAAPKAWFYDRGSGSTVLPDTGYGKWHGTWIGDTVTPATPGFTAYCKQFYEVSYGAP